MKLTKSELKQMIREALREELLKPLKESCPTGPDSVELPKVYKYITNTLMWQELDYERDGNTVEILFDTSSSDAANEWEESVVEGLRNFASDLGIDVDIDYEPRGAEDCVKICFRSIGLDDYENYYDED